mgnify:CR=1 FL=1|jgi:hypothetical protein
MKSFRSIEEFDNYFRYLIELKTDENIFELNNFLRISPERIAKYLDINIINFVKKVNINKKKVHNKLIICERIEVLSKLVTRPITFNYSGQVYKSRICVCVRMFDFKYKSKITKFYPTIKYLYVLVGDKSIILHANNNISKIYITIDEFNKHFIDNREDIINQILL